MQNAAKLASITYPCITVVHGAKHVVSLFFKDMFTKMPVFQCLSQFSKRCQNIFRSTCHGPHAIFKKHSIMHNRIYIGFIKISECRMARELIGLLCLLRERDILRATIALKEFKDIWEKTFWREVIVLENNEFWKYLFTLCCSLYAPMRILQLADQKIPTMDKLHYYVCQTDKLLAKYRKIAEVNSGHILELDKSMENMRFMTNMNDQYTNESDKKDNSNDDVEDINPGDKIVDYFNNGNNYNDDDDNDDEEDDNDNYRDSGNDNNAHCNATK